ncbi:helix-turn-helix domain containing protein [Mycobacterium sp. CVI_P3]|uniref:Helix-turn-helix domain containing protein n=1 Tax=Mycobacterium pinniadriaticum TaxID=2994102 RepID=A0ABT3SMJ1_9MYCO|nr:TetR/AcrR family transcriptional regulator [Mycobacterium pinniadriaticum]MCX2934289.1 helix-turn-helix domain containing protein [Mycobacterium pinniadriaticum]MCX2940673.1 helix-turn-helix domain containing protein [Mycobacterium pinniadriaticum]
MYLYTVLVNWAKPVISRRQALSAKRTAVPATRRRPAEVRSLLLDAAAETFATHGYARATKKIIAGDAGVAMSVLDRHFETKADLFAASVLVPFVELLERTHRDWLHQRNQPLADAPLMQLMINDMFNSLAEHKNALHGLALARDELGDDIVTRLRDAFDNLFAQFRLMAELEAERRQWFSPVGLDLTLRILMAMVMGANAYDWIILPEKQPSAEQLVEAMSELALWGLERKPRTQPPEQPPSRTDD